MAIYRNLKKSLFILVLIILASYLYAYYSLEDFSDFDKSDASGYFTELTYGEVLYNWYGDRNGEVTVLIHGLTTPSIIWQKTIDSLVESGHRVLTYDLYGRGYSSRPRVTYDATFYNDQLRELLAALQVSEPVNVVGYSLGGGIAVSFASEYPQQVKRLALITPTGLIREPSFFNKIAQVPALGDWFAMTLLPFTASLTDAGGENEAGQSAEVRKHLQQQYRFRGTIRALLSTARNYPHSGLEDAYTIVANKEIPVLLLWGENDRKIPFALSQRVLEKIPYAEFHAIKNIGHSLIYDRAEEVNQYLVGFLQSNPQKK